MVIILLAECIFLWIQPNGIDGLSGWFNAVGTNYDNVQVVIENILMSGRYVDKLDPVIWSLVIEMRIAIIFPFLYFLVKDKPVYISIAVMMLSFLVGLLFLTSIGGSFFLIGETIFHMGFFILGIMIALYWKQVKCFSLQTRAFFLIFCIILYDISGIFDVIGFPLKTSISDFIVGISCFGILIICYQTQEVQRYLEKNLFIWLGKISFSLYLVHCVVFIPLVYTFVSVGMSVDTILLMSIPLLFIIAVLFYRFVEKPTIILGQRTRVFFL
ncbi:acyltransferase family protein [Listeria grandensis]|uniref:acyltransferase family protein n=1 Tax=Listeria grandensis TaxID=1494963 RepID=UPI0021AB1861|nr:acyltransferase [Listeria grandensis]